MISVGAQWPIYVLEEFLKGHRADAHDVSRSTSAPGKIAGQINTF